MIAHSRLAGPSAGNCFLRRKVNMKNVSRQLEPPQFLSGWKEIANYLGKGVRTVQRYEGGLGLPVRRPAGKPRGSVLATRTEIDAWVSATPFREVFRLKRATPGSTSSQAQKIHSGIKEMIRLREQMLGLRSELKASLELLQMSLKDLQSGVTAWGSRSLAGHDGAGWNSVMEPSRRLGMVAVDTWQKRAS